MNFDEVFVPVGLWWAETLRRAKNSRPFEVVRRKRAAIFARTPLPLSREFYPGYCRFYSIHSLCGRDLECYIIRRVQFRGISVLFARVETNRTEIRFGLVISLTVSRTRAFPL